MARTGHVAGHRRPARGVFSRLFWKDAIERAVRAGAAAALGGVGADQIGALRLPSLRAALVIGAGGAVVSLLLSLAASRTGEAGAAFTSRP
ncbi:holin [Nonomuraea sp. NPDC052265]|uniref:holin n=1 Tax=Nonomuraea sp. NPDC052265 TaxID=3364374 RepID=UPI0037CA9839